MRVPATFPVLQAGRRRLLTGVTAAAGLWATGCTTTGLGDAPGGRSGTAGTAAGTAGPTADNAAKRREISAAVDNTLARLDREVRGARELVGRARGVLVFPSVLAAGLVVGGEYGEGELRTGGRSAGFYRTTTGSIGLQAGAQSKAMVFLFMTQEALDRFRNSEGWAVGADASVAVMRVGANGDIDTTTAQQPVVVFVMTNAGLMANLTLEGTKVTRLAI